MILMAEVLKKQVKGSGFKDGFLGGGFKYYVLFSPLFGEDFQFD